MHVWSVWNKSPCFSFITVVFYLCNCLNPTMVFQSSCNSFRFWIGNFVSKTYIVFGLVMPSFARVIIVWVLVVVDGVVGSWGEAKDDDEAECKVVDVTVLQGERDELSPIHAWYKPGVRSELSSVTAVGTSNVPIRIVWEAGTLLSGGEKNFFQLQQKLRLLREFE